MLPFADQDAAVLEGLSRIHGAGVLHGDPELRNVLLPDASSTSGRPVWVDFEWSRALDPSLAGSAQDELDECRCSLEERATQQWWS